jgi:hypothetical protein
MCAAHINSSAHGIEKDIETVDKTLKSNAIHQISARAVITLHGISATRRRAGL